MVKTITPLTRIKERYTDFRRDFEIHPVKMDLVKNKDEDAVISSIYNILRTNVYERFFQPEFGAGIDGFLFENIDQTTSLTIESKISIAISNHEPRANLLQVSAVGVPDLNGYYITIVFSLINKQEPVTTTFLLNRIR